MHSLSALFQQAMSWILPVAEGLGAPGLAIIAFLDSSFLSLPQVGDALIVALTIQHPERWMLYSGATILGSTAGCFVLYVIARKGGDAGAPNFALVQVVGCLTSDTSTGYRLTNATEPVVTRENAPTAAAIKNAETKALGRQTFSLVSIDASVSGGALDGHKVEARGLLYRDGAYADLNLTSLKNVAAACTK